MPIRNIFFNYVFVTFLLSFTVSVFQVILHDAVRPFADEEMLRRVTLAAKQYGVKTCFDLLTCCISKIVMMNICVRQREVFDHWCQQP